MNKKVILLSLMAILTCNVQPGWADMVTLGWQANGEDDLAGYKLYYGTTSRDQGSYDETEVISDKDAITWELDLSPNTYYFALTAFDTSGNESGFSTEVSAVISASSPLGKPGTPILIE